MSLQSSPHPPRFIKLNTVADRVGLGRSTLLAWEATGRFPRAVRLSPTVRVWLEEDVDNWILERRAESHRIIAGVSE